MCALITIPTEVLFDSIVGFAIPFFLLTIGIEIWIRVRMDLPKYDRKDALASITMGAGSAVLNFGVKAGAFIAFAWLYQFRVFEIGSAWWAWLILFFLEDFSFYMHHRACHEIRLFWAGHVNHHSSTNYNLAVALRQSWGELFHKYIWWLWLPLLGFHPLMVLTLMSVSLIYQFWLHTETIRRFPAPIEWIFNTPSHHRVHHGSNVRYMDRNHAGILIIWDRIFGTFQPELEEEKVVYGITENIETYNPLEIASHEYRNMFKDIRRSKALKHKLGYIFMPPGWSHDGSTKTANQMRSGM